MCMEELETIDNLVKNCELAVIRQEVEKTDVVNEIQENLLECQEATDEQTFRNNFQEAKNLLEDINCEGSNGENISEVCGTLSEKEPGDFF